jgi:hypothetical protein
VRRETKRSLAVRRLARFLDHRSPRVAAFARPAWRAVRAWLGRTGYWQGRRHLAYYQEVVRLARAHVPAGSAVLDVGASDTRVLADLDWFPRRVALDITPMPRQPGIERVSADFLAYRPPLRFDLVLCLQVLEHLQDPEPFARKLLDSGRIVIVLVPYQWPAGRNPRHLQDPVSEAKLIGWAGRAPVETRLVRNGVDRLIAVFRGTASD